jgi:hypothetical protein
MSKATKKSPEKLQNFKNNTELFFLLFSKSTQKSIQKASKFWREFNLATALVTIALQ